MTDPKQIFISYRRDGAVNQQWAEKIDARLIDQGFKVWRDVEGIQPGQRWNDKIPNALEHSALVLCVVSTSLLDSLWVDSELNYARTLKLLIVPIRIESEYRPPFMLGGVQPFDLHNDSLKAWDKLFEFVDRHAPRVEGDSIKLIAKQADHKRQRELEYLDRLLYSGKQVAQLTPIYTELASSVEHRVKNLASALPADLIPASFLHQSAAARKSGDGQRYDDILKVFESYEHETPRLVLLGEPGSGKSFALRRLSALRALIAQEDPKASLPLLVELGDWIEEEDDLPFHTFLRNSLTPLETSFDELVTSGRAYLLLDALNEIPSAQQSSKVEQIRKWVDNHHLAGLVISCRERDFTNHLQLELDTVTIEPLDPTRVYQFIQRYLQVIDPANAKNQGEKLFWQLATGHPDNYPEIEIAKQFWRQLQDEGIGNFSQFWQRTQDTHLNEADRWRLDQSIDAIEKDPSSLLKLAKIPYLLNILVGLFLEGKLPEQGKNRAEVLSRFIEDLMLRESKRFQKYGDNKMPPGEPGLLDALSALAWSLQRASHGNQQKSAQTRLPASDAQMALSNVQLDHAVAANLLQVSYHQVNFIHQLVQEYFAALELKRQIEARLLSAEELWPKHDWWKSKGWDETVITAASLFSNDISTFIEWLGDVNPELLAESLVFNGLLASTNISLQKRVKSWTQRMTNPLNEPHPAARASIGRALGKLECDDRPGVGIDENGLPSIDWVKINGGVFLYGEARKSRKIKTFYIARYPVTNVQFQAFINDKGYQNERWWDGLSHRTSGPNKSTWAESNRPREAISWQEAIAYCRWLSEKLGYSVELPNELQWERAARGTDGREYPWGDEYRSGYANLNESSEKTESYDFQETTTVGIYPQGASSEGVHDMAGNVWEWCLNEYANPDNVTKEGDKARVLRGGSWGYFPVEAFTWFRGRSNSFVGNFNFGFRVACSSPKTS